MMGMEQDVQMRVRARFGGTIPASLGEIIHVCTVQRNLGVVALDAIQDKYPEASYGLLLAIKEALRECRKAANMRLRTPKDARLDRILRTRDSDGKSRGRKFAG
jgi:hypothetical protein